MEDSELDSTRSDDVTQNSVSLHDTNEYSSKQCVVQC